MDRRIPYYTLGFLCSEYKLILRGLPESNSVIVTPVHFDIFLFHFSNQNTKSTWDVLLVLFALCSIRSWFSYSLPWLSHICASCLIKRCDNWTLVCLLFFLQVAPAWGLGLLSALRSQGEFNPWYLIHHQALSQALQSFLSSISLAHPLLLISTALPQDWS